MNKRIIIVVLICLFILPNVYSMMPKYTHKWILSESLKTPTDSNFYKYCAKYPSLCYSGNVLSDIGVLFYFSERGKYQTEHNPNFCRLMIENAYTDEDKACAVGACTHQPADLPSHTKMVPYAIRHTLLMNNLIHVFSEQKVDNYVENEYGTQIEKEAVGYLNDYKKCVPLFIKVLVGDPEYSDLSESEINELFDKFVTEVQNSEKTGYDTSFKTKSFFVNIKAIPLVVLGLFSLFMFGFLTIVVLLVFKVIKKEATVRHYVSLAVFVPIIVLMGYLFIGNLYGSAFNNFINVIKPVSNIVPVGDEQGYIDEAISNTKSLLNQGEIWLYGTDASGFEVLDATDKQVALYDYLLLSILSILLAIYIWYLFKKNKFTIDFKL